MDDIDNVKLTATSLDDRTVKVDAGELGEIVVMVSMDDDGTIGLRVVNDAAPGVPVRLG